jgi:peroxiredoxin
VETILVVSSILLWLVVLLNLLLTLALVRRLNASRTHQVPVSEMGLKRGEIAPEFTAQTLASEMVTLHSYAGRNTVFIFISTHCAPCHEILPSLVSLGPKAARAGVELVLVSGNELDETRALMEQEQIRLPVLVAPRGSNSFLEDYKATEVPTYCFIDEQGKVQSTGYPGQQWEEWKLLTASWLARDSSTVYG